MASVEEKVELTEQTPLTTVVVETEGQPEAAKKEKKWWFKKGAKKAETTTEENAETAATEGEREKPKKNHWWNKKPCCETTCTEAGPTFGIDYARRDEQQLQSAIDLTFADIFGEPDSLHSFNGVWRVTHSIFTAVRNFFYKLFAIVIFIPAAFVFGILFALVSALGVYVIVPAGRLLSIPAVWIFKLWSYVVAGIVEPVGVGLGAILSRIKVHRYGINNDPTATMGA